MSSPAPASVVVFSLGPMPGRPFSPALNVDSLTGPVGHLVGDHCWASLADLKGTLLKWTVDLVMVLRSVLSAATLVPFGTSPTVVRSHMEVRPCWLPVCGPTLSPLSGCRRFWHTSCCPHSFPFAFSFQDITVTPRQSHVPKGWLWWVVWYETCRRGTWGQLERPWWCNVELL